MSPKFNLDDRLAAVESRALGSAIPLPLHERLDQLCEVVYAARYARPPIRKMIAALILAAPNDAQQLQRLLQAFDAALVQDALLSSEGGTNIVEFPRRKSGPRPAR